MHLPPFFSSGGQSNTVKFSIANSTFESAEARLLCGRAGSQASTRTDLLLLSLLLKSLARFGYVGCKDQYS